MSFNDYGFDDALPDSAGGGFNGAGGSEEEAPQLNAIEHDRWATGIAERYLYNNSYTSTRLKREMRDDKFGESQLEQAEQLFADSFSAFFGDNPRLNESCSDKRKLEFFKELLDTSEIQAQRRSTKYKTSRSLAAATTVAESFIKYINQEHKPSQSKQSAPDAHWSEQEEEEQSGGGDPLAMQEKIDDVSAQIEKDLDELDDLSNQFFPGDGHQECGNETTDSTELFDTFKRVRQSSMLHDIAKYAGKYIQLAKSSRKNKSPHGNEDRDGIKFGKRPTHLTISELGKARNPKMRLDLMRRMVENKAVVRNIHGYDTLGKGPIVVVLDESGSMSGRPIVHAKAIAMTFAWIARKQRRWCCMVSYEGGGRTKTLTLGTSKWDQSAMCEYLETFLCGGGYVDLPIRELPLDIYPGLGAPKGKTDVIMISDGEYSLSNIDTEHIDRFNKWRKNEKANVTSICIRSHNADVLESVSDTVHLISELSEDSAAVGSAFASV